MKEAALQYLRCPACGGGLRLAATETEASVVGPEVMSGSLSCQRCPEQYPIIKGVPRMLLGDFRRTMEENYKDLFGTRQGRSRRSETVEVRTMESFGYEWRHFSDIAPEGEQNFLTYFEAYPPSELAGKVVLDVGCGKGRHLYYAARYARECVGIDLSFAVDAAFANTRHLENVHIVQANLFQAPLEKSSFDVVYSLGVLHHLPDPEAGFREMLRYGRPGAAALIYLYHRRSEAALWQRGLLAAVGQLRRLTTRMPFAVLRALCWVIALGCEILFVLPYKMLRRVGLRGVAESLPLKSYAQYPFSVLYQDQFDRFSAPIENRYEREEVQGWLERSGLTQQTILGGAGWRASGRIPAGMPAGSPTKP